jgi:hypothetical protein
MDRVFLLLDELIPEAGRAIDWKGWKRRNEKMSAGKSA